MNKKERNRKLVKQNKRNRIINRRYISTIKTLTKLFNTKLKTFEVETRVLVGGFAISCARNCCC